MIDIVKKYNSYLEQLPELVKNSMYKAEFFYKTLECSEQTYYRKLRENGFTVKEVEKITELLYPKEFYAMELKKELEQGRSDFFNGHFITNDEMKSKRKIKKEV